MNAVANVLSFPVEHPVDRLGALKAQIAELEREADAIADSLRAQGKGLYEGSLFKASVADETLVSTFDAAAAKAKLLEVGVAQSWIDGNVKISIRKPAVKVVSR
jgi:hypothetical protein